MIKLLLIIIMFRSVQLFQQYLNVQVCVITKCIVNLNSIQRCVNYNVKNHHYVSTETRKTILKDSHQQ